MQVTHMLRLYPRSWRERYEDEMLALLEQVRVTPGTLFDLAFGALDAQLQSALAAGRFLPMLNPLRRITLAVFWAWVAYVLAGLAFYGTLDDNPLTVLARTDLNLRLSVWVVQASAALSLLAVLAGALPVGFDVLRRAWLSKRRDVLFLMFGVPLLCLAVLALAFALMLGLVLAGLGQQAPLLFHGFQALFVLSAIVSTAAVSAAVNRSDVELRVFRFVRVPAVLAALSMVLTLLGIFAWGASALASAPQTFYTAPALLDIDTAHVWLAVAVVMTAATLGAIVMALRAFTQPPAASDAGTSPRTIGPRSFVS